MWRIFVRNKRTIIRFVYTQFATPFAYNYTQKPYHCTHCINAIQIRNLYAIYTQFIRNFIRNLYAIVGDYVREQSYELGSAAGGVGTVSFDSSLRVFAYKICV